MAQSRNKRRRKHRGTQAGTIETPSHRAGKSTKAAASTKPTQRAQRTMRPPTWKAAAYKAAAAALVFALFLYLPIAYWTDKAMYRRRQAKMQAGK
jgi:hypothetical protein